MGIKTIEFWAQGTTPMLINRATEEALKGGGGVRANTPGEEIEPRDQAEKVVYRLDEPLRWGGPKTVARQLYFVGAGVARAVCEAGGNHKAKGSRKALKWLVPAAVNVMTEKMPLFLNDRKTPVVEYEVYSVPVIIPATKGRIMRHRPRVNEWSLRCELRIKDHIISEDTIRMLLIEGLQQQGLGDWRPSCKGSFGISDLVSWKVISESKKKTEAQAFAAGEMSEAAE